MKALLLPPRKEPEIITIDTWDDLSAVIGCRLVETILLEQGVLLVCDEEFTYDGAIPNRRIGNNVFAGPLIIIGEDPSGNLTGLTDETLRKYFERYRQPEFLFGRFDVRTTVDGNVITINQQFIEGDHHYDKEKI